MVMGSSTGKYSGFRIHLHLHRLPLYVLSIKRMVSFPPRFVAGPVHQDAFALIGMLLRRRSSLGWPFVVIPCWLLSDRTLIQPLFTSEYFHARLLDLNLPFALSIECVSCAESEQLSASHRLQSRWLFFVPDSFLSLAFLPMES